jgi:hypothetical protein
MPSLTANDRLSLCLFTYEDHRRCRTPRISTHPHFCFYHAKKESQSQAATKLANDIAYFFSGDYLSANDLNAALGRLIPATIRGEIKPRLARTVAYMLQTLMQSTRQAQHEYINAFSTDGWRQAICDSVNANHDHLYPPPPVPAESHADPETADESEHVVKCPVDSQPTAEPQPTPPTSIGAGLVYAESRSARPATPTSPPQPPPPTRPSPADAEAALAIARQLFRERPNAPTTQSATTIAAPPTNTASTQSDPPTAAIAPPTNPTTPAPTSQTNEAPPPPPQPATPRRQPGAPIREDYPYRYGPEYRLTIDGKPW